MKLSIVVIHGLGSQEPGYSTRLQFLVSRQLERLEQDPGEVAWKEIYWGDVLERRERDYLDRAEATSRLDWDRTRAHVVRGFGDAAAYQYTGRPTSAYVGIHDRIREHIRALYEDVLGSQPTPMVVLGHSLGSHIASSYIWDTQNTYDTGAARDADPFERMDWLAGMITFGSTIPLFTFAYDPVRPIAFPGEALPDPVRAAANWLNFYDADDVLGYPLQPINADYDKLVQDHEINVGNVLKSWNPLSHNGYWKDRDFVRPVAGYLAELLRA